MFFSPRLGQGNLITRTDFDAKLIFLNRKITQNKTKHLLVESELTNLENKIPDVSSLVKKTDYNTKVTEIDDKFVKLKNLLVELGKRFLPYMSGNIIFDGGDGSQAYLIFQSVHKYIKTIAKTKYISKWKSEGLSDESIKSFLTSGNSLTPLIDYYDYHIRLKFNRSILIQPKVSYTHGVILSK